MDMNNSFLADKSTTLFGFMSLYTSENIVLDSISAKNIPLHTTQWPFKC